MKQIRLKDKVEIIESPIDCPCYDGEYGECNLDPAIEPTTHFPETCPLENYYPPKKITHTDFKGTPHKLKVKSCGKCLANRVRYDGENECCHVKVYDEEFDTEVDPNKIMEWCPLEDWTEEDEKELQERRQNHETN